MRRLQAAVGNQAVTRIVTRPADSAGAVRETPGLPLEAALREDLEARFDEDLGSVRVHTDPVAADAAGAVAYTIGEHIVFNAGAYAPHRKAGRALLAHELAHVIQQRQGAGGSAPARQEGEAGRIGHAVLNEGGPVTVRESGPVGLARQEKPGEPEQPVIDFHRDPADGRQVVTVDGIPVLRYTPPANEDDLRVVVGWAGSTKTVYLDAWRARASPGVSFDNDGIGRVQARGWKVRGGEHFTDTGEAASRLNVEPAQRRDAARQAVGPTSQLTAPSQAASAQSAPGSQPRPAPAQAAPADPDLAGRAATIRANLKGFTFNISWSHDIADAFKGLTPDDFQRLQALLGEKDLNDAFDQMPPFLATLVGTFGPFVKSNSTLNDKRAEFIVDVKDYGSARAAYYRWMFKSMSVDDMNLVLRLVGGKKHLKDTILSVPGLAQSLVGRGVDTTALQEEETTLGEGIKRGLGKVWDAAWSGTVFGSGTSVDSTDLPQEFRDSVLNAQVGDFTDSLTTTNIVRGVAANVTLGLSEVPVGIYGAGDAAVRGTIDLWNGKTGDAAEKFTPVVIMILAALAGKAVGKLTGGTAAREAALLRDTPGLPSATPALPSGVPATAFEVVSLEKTAEGLDRWVVRAPNGELAEMLVNMEKGTIRATRLATGEVLNYANGRVTRPPASLSTAAAGLVIDEPGAPGTMGSPSPAPLTTAADPAAAVDLRQLPGSAARPLLGPGPGAVETSLLPPVTRDTTAAALRAAQAQDALTAARTAAAEQRARVLTARRELDAALARQAETRGSARARELVRNRRANLRAAEADLKPLSGSEKLAIAEHAQVLNAQRRITDLTREVARLDAELTEMLHPAGGFSQEARSAGRSPGMRPNWLQPGGPAYYAKASELAAARTRLNAWVVDLTVSLKDQVDEATPGPAARPAALANAASLESTALHPVNGRPIDVTTGLPMETRNPATDHIMSRDEIASDPRFARLSPLKREEILLDVPENYLPFTTEANSSKGALSVEEWIAARAKKNPISPEMAKALREADVRARKAIDAFFHKNEGK